MANKTWEQLRDIHLALCETFSDANKTDPQLRVKACVAKYGRDQVDDGGCDRVDCSICDALHTMRELLG